MRLPATKLNTHCAFAWWQYACVCQSCFWSDGELSSFAKLCGDMACSLPGNLGHPQSYTALYKSLKYSTCTVVVTMQKYTSTPCLCVFLRTSFPARSRVWELCVLFLSRDRSGAQQSGKGKTVHLPFIMHNKFHPDTAFRPISKKGLHLPQCIHFCHKWLLR